MTHALDCLPKCDRIILLDKGEIEFEGTYQELISTQFFENVKSSLDTSHFENENEESEAND